MNICSLHVNKNVYLFLGAGELSNFFGYLPAQKPPANTPRLISLSLLSITRYSRFDTGL